ncbi:PSP1 domain-containing protein [Saprospiraceae bacterium]|nr:PSP1 domain-containing protein [Saprospiraceae bacterium]
MGAVGRFDAANFQHYQRDARVICRTQRGLEFGKVLCSLDDHAVNHQDVDGQLLRFVGSEDELILERLERYRDKAFQACQQLISSHRLPAVLVDVEHLFDGESVYFYFLGDIDPQLELLTHELANTYENKVRFKKFAETLANGCGPDCGTGASGCASGSCGSCGLTGSCQAQG